RAQPYRAVYQKEATQAQASVGVYSKAGVLCHCDGSMRGRQLLGTRIYSTGAPSQVDCASIRDAFRQRQQNAYNDAEAIAEAAQRPNMRFVPIKAVEQQDIQNFHRQRERLKRERTALVNQIRGLLAEYGIVINKGVAAVREALPDLLEDAENGL